MFKDLVGHIPEESKALFAYSLLKVLGNKRGITMIKFNSRGFSWLGRMRSKILKLVQSLHGMRFLPR